MTDFYPFLFRFVVQIYLFFTTLRKYLNFVNAIIVSKLYNFAIYMETINTDLFNFISANKETDPQKVLLTYHDKDIPFSLPFAITQLMARRKSAYKLSDFISNERFLFPDALAAEQATDQRVANFHATLVGSNKNVLDLTAGLGIDAITIAKFNNNVTACEIMPAKADILSYNSNLLSITDFEVINQDCRIFLNQTDKTYDVIFIDPARRDSNNNRTYSLNDCNPDVKVLLPLMQKLAPVIFIKVSPILDVTRIIEDIPDIKAIFAVCVKGECKELLLEVSKDTSFQSFRVVDLDDNGIISDIDFSYNELIDKNLSIKGYIGTPTVLSEKSYLYEPNAGVMKLPRKAILTKHFPELIQVGKNTPLFVSNELYDTFPGRILEIESIIRKSDYSQLKGRRYNIVSRNYPVTPDNLRKKLKVLEGKDNFIYAFRSGNDNTPMMVTAHRIR